VCARHPYDAEAVMHLPPHIKSHVEAFREFLRLNGIPAVVVQASSPAVQPVAPLRLCEHCRLPIGSAGEHGACAQYERERSVSQ
jgi:hypothetical protein